MLNALIMLVVVVTAGALMMPRLANAPLWRATITPLASIIGSGFLVIGPILLHAFGFLAPGVMALLCLGAYLFGAAIRFNMAQIDDRSEDRSKIERRLDGVASWALAFAYVISVAYYLNLFGEFGLSLTRLDDQFHARLLATAPFLIILFIGWSYGFKALERMEQVAVGLKLSIIAGLLFGLAWYFAGKLATGDLSQTPPLLSGWSAVALGFGLVVTVQGFETSRYLGATYSADLRMRSMRLAQIIASVIYMVYICLLAYAFPDSALELDETAIIDMMGIVAPILSVLLVAAALSAQFSAAVADAGGSGGLIAELTRQAIKPRAAYVILVAIGLTLTWSFDVFEIMSHASRAFAFYYALQSAIATLAAKRKGQTGKVALFGALSILGLAITLFGVPVE